MISYGNYNVSPPLAFYSLAALQLYKKKRLEDFITQHRVVKEVGHTFVVMVCILPIFNSLWHHFGIVIFDAYSDTTIVPHRNIFLENVFSLKVA